jgi:uncharacterized protein YciI
MFIILLRFSAQKSKAPQFLEAHKQWLQRGFADGVFLLAGSLEPSQGGGILAIGADRESIEQRVNEDPFVAEKVVSAEILELDPGRADERLQFLIP